MARLFCSLLILIVLSPIFACALSPSLSDDVLGLIVFKADVHDPQKKLESWNEDDDNPCNWTGVRCDPRSHRVTELLLDGFSLTGKLGHGLLKLQFLHTLLLAKNNLNGSLNFSLAQFPNLRVLDLSHNSLFGPFPDNFFEQCGSLRSLSLSKNKLSGTIPESISSCSALVYLNISSNRFSGQVPSKIWSLTRVRSFDLSDNLLDGEIPNGIEAMNNLRVINFQKNKLRGGIPNGIGACLLLRSIDLGENYLSGELPHNMWKLRFCNILNVRKNLLTGPIPEWIGKMRNLEELDISMNNFSSQLPPSVGELIYLTVLNISTNAFTGPLPESMGGCRNLLFLDVSQNSLSGEMPSWVFKLGLQQIVLSNNKFNGNMHNALSFSTEDAKQRLTVLDVSNNLFSGEIPAGLGDYSSLKLLRLSRNSFLGGIPSSIGQKSLSTLDLSENLLNGSIPSEICRATFLKELRMDKNLLIGSIPASIGNCSSLYYLSMSMNNLSGPLPDSMGNLSYLQYVDLSFNYLSGNLPKQLANLVRLVYFNISHNQLQGELPSGVFFSKISPYSVAGNPGLCGYPVNITCPTVLPKPIVLNPNSSNHHPGLTSPKIGHEKKILSISALIAIGAAIMIAIGVIAITVLNLHVRATASHSAGAFTFSDGDDFMSKSPGTDASSGKLVMFNGDLDFGTRTHALLNKDCELGHGGFGTVYRTILKNGKPVAIKKLEVSYLVKSQEDFEREVKKLGKAHHQNLVSFEGYYWSSSLQLLIYEFVSCGTLYKHLHEGSNGMYLSWNERFTTILGIAKGLAYLHQMNIIHYNLKSSNVLINISGEPKVSDYGLATLLPMLDRYVLSSKIQSALGYMAPEFACKTVKITEKCDVYGFGVLLLEILTGKKPVEYMEDDVVVICDMVRKALEDGKVEECVDTRLQGKFPADEAVPMIKLGLICTSQVPSNRPNMAEVVDMLELIQCPSVSHDELV